MKQDDVLFGYRLQVFALAERTSVAEACRVFGIPQTNGHVENLHKTILDECWRPAFARALYPSLSGLKRDLADYLRTYNYDRIHRGRLTRGMIPADISDPARKMRPNP